MPSFLKSRRGLASLALVAITLILVSAQPAHAQLPDFGTVQDKLKDTLRPVFQIARYLIVGFCIITGLYEGFKATRGHAKGWLTAFLLFLVAGIAVSPSEFLRIIGLNTLAGMLSDYGL